jgi:hypothetical protein
MGVCGTTGCGTFQLRLNESHGGDCCGAGDFWEIINTGSCTLDASTLSLAMRYSCDSVNITFDVPAGTMIPGGGILRIRDTSGSLMSNELYIGRNVCHNPASSGWVALCQGPCDLSACTNFLDYLEEHNASPTRPTAAPSCGSFTPAPVSTAGQSSTQSVIRTAFTGTGGAGVQSDWTIGMATR